MIEEKFKIKFSLQEMTNIKSINEIEVALAKNLRNNEKHRYSQNFKKLKIKKKMLLCYMVKNSCSSNEY